MDMKEKLVSIIIPVYNAEKYILRCVESVKKQSYKNIEIILVNDGSTDNSKKLCNEIINTDKRIKVINKENGGVHTARNEGIRIANGDYITFIDIDDWIEEDYILTLIKIIESKNIDLAICNYKDVYIESNKEEYSSNDNGEDREINISELIDERFFFNGLINPCWGKLYKMSIIKGQGIRFESLKLSEDTLFNLNYLSFCKNIFITSKRLYFYVHYKNSNNLTSKVYKDMFKDYLKVHKKYLELIKRYNNNEKDIYIVDKTMYFQYYNAISKIFNSKNIKYKEKRKIINLALDNELIVNTFCIDQKNKSINLINKLIVNKKYLLLKFIYFYLYNICSSERVSND